MLKNSNFTLHFSSVVLGIFQVLVHTVNLTRFKITQETNLWAGL